MIFPALAAPAYLHQQCTGRRRWKGYVIKSTNEEYKESMCSKYNTKIWDSKCLHWCEDIAWMPVPALWHVPVCPSQGSVAWLAPDTGSCPRPGLAPHRCLLSGHSYFGGLQHSLPPPLQSMYGNKLSIIQYVKMSNHQKEKENCFFFHN